jgi:hypothetical protein
MKVHDSSTRALRQSNKQSHLVGKQEELANEMINFALRSRAIPFILQRVLYLPTLWHDSSCRTLAATHILCEILWQQIFAVWGSQPHAQLPTWRTRVSLLVWHLPRNLSRMGGPTCSYAASGIALEFIGAHKPPHPATKCFWQGRDTIKGAKGSLMSNKILQCGADGFTSPPKECILQIFIALKYPSPLAGFEPMQVVSNGKHANH